MNVETREGLKTLSNVVTALCVLVLVPMHGWAILQIVSHGQRLSVVEQRILSHEPPYNRLDAERDQGVFMRVLESHGKVIDDHEGRLRIIERGVR